MTTAAPTEAETALRDARAVRLPSLRLPALGLPAGYPLAAVAAFLALVASLVALRAELPEDALRDLHWVLALAVVPILPWLLPLAARHVSEVRAGPVELALRDVDPSRLVPEIRDVDDIELGLVGASVADMPTRSRDILERVKEIEAGRTEVVVLNLGGSRWRLASLYFLVFLIESRTMVRRLVLEGAGGPRERAFVGMCSPRALRRSLEREHPLYRAVRKATPLIELDESGKAFFHALAAESARAGIADPSPAVDTSRVVQILGPAVEPEWMDGREAGGLPGVRRVLASERRYVAVVDPDGSYRVIDRLRVALEIARRATGA